MSRPRGKASDPAHFVVYIDAAGRHRWRIVGRDGRVVAESGDSFPRLQRAVDEAQRVRDLLRATDVPVQVDLRRHVGPKPDATVVIGPGVAQVRITTSGGGGGGGVLLEAGGAGGGGSEPQ